MSGAYYNELDPYAAEWLRNLIAAGHIAPGDVDTRDIRDVRPDDLRGYTQCHFFAGIGVWSYALRLAGWPDDRPVWTGSCPCQPFSAAGAGLGFADERHLWPHWFHLIRECRPATVLGEQVASKDVDPWIDLVQDDMESLGDAFGALAFPAASVGSPNIRDRAYWMAYASNRKRNGLAIIRGTERYGQDARRSKGCSKSEPRRHVGRMADLHTHGRKPWLQGLEAMGYRTPAKSGCRAGGMADADVDGLQGGAVEAVCGARGGQEGHALGCGNRPLVEIAGAASPTNGFWRDADWLLCRDGKWRPVEPGTFPLAHGAPARVGRLRAYGNAINAEQAAEFIRCADEAIEEIA